MSENEKQPDDSGSASNDLLSGQYDEVKENRERAKYWLETHDQSDVNWRYYASVLLASNRVLQSR